MKTGLVRDAQQMKQCVYSNPCDCVRCYIGESIGHLEVGIKEHNYNLAQGLLEEQKQPNMNTQKAAKYVGMKRRSCRLNQTPPTGNTRNPLTCLW
jgi:hypothetical protein